MFGLVWFYGISTIVGYLMINPLYTYISNINMIFKDILSPSFFCTMLNGFKYCYVSHNLASVINVHTKFVLFDPLIGPRKVLPFWVRVDLRAMAMKGSSTFSKYPRLDPHHQM